MSILAKKKKTPGKNARKTTT